MDRRLAAILAADIVGYSRLMESDEEGTLSRQNDHLAELVNPRIQAHRGRVFKTTGDGFLAEFPSAVDAVMCAAEIQRGMDDREAEVRADRRISYRIGINVGDIVHQDDDLYGDGVNVAARLESLADTGGIMVSESVFYPVRNKVDLGFEDLGEQKLKNISEPVRVYRVRLDPDAVGKVVTGRLRRPRKRVPPEALAAAAVIVVLGGGLVVRDFVLRDTTRQDARDIRSSALEQLSETEDPRRIAVLYFEPRSPQEEVPYLAAGLTEALIDELSTVDALHVVSSNGVATFRDAVVAPDSIGRALEVGTLVNGTVALSGDQVEVRVSFVNASNGRQFSGTRIVRERADLFELQAELADEVAAFFREMLGEEVEFIERQAGAENVEAWELMQQASALKIQAIALDESGDSEGAMARASDADALLAEAEEIAPEWVEPTVERGWLDYERSRWTGFDDRSAADEWTAQGLEHAEVAIRLVPDHADGLELRGILQYWRYLLNLASGPAELGRLVERAEADFRASVASNSQQASAWNFLSHLLANQERPAEAKNAARRSYEADPYLRNVHFTLWRLFFISFDLGDGVEARRWCEESRRRFPDQERFRQCGIMVYALSDTEPDVPRTWELLEEYVALSPPGDKEFNEHKGEMLVAMALTRAGLADSARAVAVRARAGPEIDSTREVPFWESAVRSMLGDIDEGLEQLSIHVAANPTYGQGGGAEPWYRQELERDPRYAIVVAAE
jgi:class 3 adenylate cyclase/TolB-like protein